MFTGYLLSPESRTRLLQAFPPKYGRILAHHITLNFGIKKNDPAPDMPKSVEVIGHFDEDGVEGLTVAIDGNTVRPDKKLFHITWSLAEDRMPVDSNKYTHDSVSLDKPIEIKVIPKNFHNP